MLDLKEIQRQLQDRRLSSVSRATGLHYNTVYKIKQGNARNPSYQVVKALSDYLCDGVSNG